MTAPKKVDLNRLVAEIGLGRHDGDLGTINKAIRDRVKDGQSSFRWRITLGDDEWTEDSLTLGEIRMIEQVLAGTWLTVPKPGASGAAAAAYIVAHFHAVGGLTKADAIAKADALSVIEVDEAITEYEVPKPGPKDPGTSTSS